MRMFPLALAILMVAATADAGEIVFRPPATGTLNFTIPPPPGLEIPDPIEPEPPANFGITYVAIKVRAGTYLAITPTWPSGHSQTGFTFEGVNLPAGITLNVATGLITGRIATVGTHGFTILISNGTGTQSIPVSITVT